MPELHSSDRQGELLMNTSSQDQDALMESILDNINATPIGRVLKRIGSLPEVRKGKVLSLRQKLTEGTYDVNDRLDLALDKVIEDLTS
jgi:hypothetical protein